MMFDCWKIPRSVHYLAIANDESCGCNAKKEGAGRRSFFKALALAIVAISIGYVLGYHGHSQYNLGLLGRNHYYICFFVKMF